MESNNAKVVLKEVWGYDKFLPFQEEVINHLISGNDTIALLPTGGGKSLCFQVPGILSGGLTVVISPLVSLITDQVNRLNNLGLSAISLTGEWDSQSWDKALDKGINGDYHFIYISPERAISSRFRSRIPFLPIRVLAIDEAHCASQWGHDFRPSYALLGLVRKSMPEVPCIALTASATPEILKDLKVILSLETAKTFKNSFYRSNIALNILRVKSKERTLKNIFKNEGKQIIYCKTRSQTSFWVKKLGESGIKSLPYHGGLNSEIRSNNYKEWSIGEISCIVATNAFGMGVDQPNVRQVIHVEIPDSIESYYQEIGRAGRDGKEASSYLIIESNNIRSFEKRILNDSIKWEDLRDVYHKIASVNQIAVGDGLGERIPLDIKSLSEKTGKDKADIYVALKVFEREKIFVVHENFKAKPEVILSFSGSTLVEKLDELSSSEEIAYSLLRYVPECKNRWAKFSLKSLAKWSRMSLAEVHEGLDKLKQNGILDWNEIDSKVVLEWRFPRESEGHLSISRSDIEKQNLSKSNRKKFMANLLNSRNCIFADMLSYFGESKDGFKCKKCSVCNHGDDNSERNIQHNIFILISEKSLKIGDISKILNIPAKLTHKALIAGVERNLWKRSDEGKYHII
ncbi:MAG: ATP-dependent DNA helicase RecQ [Owenweeksia sp. TMED14]|nr:MAG: ATP-dependent DNA helicase RecQ [Owenweeksia sp. TMED14]